MPNNNFVPPALGSSELALRINAAAQILSALYSSGTDTGIFNIVGGWKNRFIFALSEADTLIKTAIETANE